MDDSLQEYDFGLFFLDDQNPMNFWVMRVTILPRYKQNLRIVHGQHGDYVQSYATKVAIVKGHRLIQLGWYSVTTQKHINYVSRELNLKLIRIQDRKFPHW
jgi:hypothetical protein